MNFSDRLLLVISRSIRLWRVKYIQKKNPFPSEDISDSKTTFMTLWNNVSLDKGKVTHIFQEEIIMNSKSEGKKTWRHLKIPLYRTTFQTLSKLSTKNQLFIFQFLIIYWSDLTSLFLYVGPPFPSSYVSWLCLAVVVTNPDVDIMVTNPDIMKPL